MTRFASKFSHNHNLLVPISRHLRLLDT